MTLHVDGTDEDSILRSDCARGPFAIFDDEKQDWVVTGIRWRWLARVVRCALLAVQYPSPSGGKGFQLRAERGDKVFRPHGAGGD